VGEKFVFANLSVACKTLFDIPDFELRELNELGK